MSNEMNGINYSQQKLSDPYSIAYSIANNLDAQDNNQDGKIKGSIWNQFIRNIKVGEMIGDNDSISVKQAIDRIKAYAKLMPQLLSGMLQKTKPADIKKEDCKKTNCNGVYYHEATRTHYREASGKLWKVEPRIKDARIVFNSDGTRTEHIGGVNGPQTVILVNKDNKIYKKEYYSGLILQKIETFDQNEKLIKTEDKSKKQKYDGYRETSCKGIYYHDATRSHYREINGKLQKIEPITSKDAHIMFNDDGTRYEIEHKNINGKKIAVWTLVSKNNKVIETIERPE